MLSIEKEKQRARSDAKLLFGVAAMVVLAAVALALTAGYGAQKRSTAPAVARSEAERATPRRAVPPALPASFERAAEPVVPPVDVDEVAEVEEVEPVFPIEPGENLVAAGLAAFQERDFARAAAYFAAEVEARPERAWSHYMAGLSLWKCGRNDEAAGAMREAGRREPDSVRTWVNLSRIENDRGRFDEALAAARTALGIDPEDPAALFLEGRSAMNLGDFEAAEASLARSLEIDPDNGYVHNMLGLLYLQTERAGAAVEPLERAAMLEADVAFIRNNLGMAFELTGRGAEAAAAYRAALELDPDHAASVVNLARVAPAGAELPSALPIEGPPETVADRTEIAEVDDGAVDQAAARVEPEAPVLVADGVRSE